MRKRRYQFGSIGKQRGRWIGMWYVDGGRKSKNLGLVKDMCKPDARAVVNRIVTEFKTKRDQNRIWKFGEFVAVVYFPYYSRKGKQSTRENNVNRVSVHLVAGFGDRDLSSVKQDELQDFLEAKANGGLSFSVVDRLRWDVKQVFDMAVAEGHVERDHALMLFPPGDAEKPERRVMSMKEVQTYFAVFGQREQLIAKLAVLAGMRPGEIFALKWDRLRATYSDIRQRRYRGTIDTPKTDQSVRKGALCVRLLREIELWREFSVET